MVSLVIFYAGINLGFGSGYKSQVNEVMLQAACYDLISDLRNFNLHNQYDTGLIKPNIEKKQSNDLVIIDNSFSPDSPFVAIDDSIPSLEGSSTINSLFDSTKVLDDSVFLSTDTSALNNLLDSTKVLGSVKDSSKTKVKINQDSLRLVQMALDSTARLQYFRYQREDIPYTTLKQKKKSKFFIEPSPTYKTTSVTIDSTGKFVEIKELIVGKPSKIILTVPIEEYIETRLKVEERKKWEALGYAYELKDSKIGLGELIKSFTDFEIPLPSVGVLSIFGPPKISLKIGGSVQIHGAWRSETTEGITASRLGNTRNEPDFKQQVQINVNGTIGDKLNIAADWNTERTFEYENSLKIKYTGYDDEIIQSIEAGNVSLQTSPLVGGSEALFGIKAQMKMGPFSLTTIASQKKGETKEVQVSGGTSETPFQKRAYEYSTNHFFIDTVYASKTGKVFYDYYSNPTPKVNSRLQVTKFEVWKSIAQFSNDRSKERLANAYIDLDPLGVNEEYDANKRADLTNPVPGKSYGGRFVLLKENDDYIMHEKTGFITFKSTPNDEEVIAIAFTQENGPGITDDIKYGEFLNPADTSKRLVLKMIKPENLKPGGNYAEAWSLLLKNIYALGPRGIKQEGFEFDIQREIPGQDPVSEIGTTRFLNAFGLDLLNSSQQAQPDNIFDFRGGTTIIPETGEVIFPNLEPFGDDLPASLDEAVYNFDEVYDTTKNAAQRQSTKDKWILVGKSKGSSTSIYQLGFNVVENSVKVLLNGRELSVGSDYSVDYNIGQLTIRNDAALVPGADLRITYEQNDLFSLASKTLLGARGIYEFSKKTKLGFSILNLNQQTLSDKVRIGEEPLSNSIYGLDFTTSADLPFLTKLFDNVFSTREMSSFNLSAEYAYIDPDPNTKKSTIASDDGKSIAYIDDFEGAKKTIPIGISYTSWKDISPPDSMYLVPGLTKKQLMNHKAKTFWFTETPSNVTVEDIYYDKKQVARTDQQISVLDFVFLPDTPGTYNYEPNLDERNKSWGGIMKLVSSTANNLLDENIEYIEFWAQTLNGPSDLKVYIDIGKISEDVIPNGELDTEDREPRNDAIDPDGTEDTGIDGKMDDAERLEYNSTKSDPSGDNFFFQRGSQPYPYDYFSINGTQGNAVLTDIGRIPDTEDLNRNDQVDLSNNYFRYEVSLDSNFATNPFLAGGGLNPKFREKNIPQWYLYRIPLRDYKEPIGDPSFTDVKTIRMFIQGADSMVHFRVTEFNLVGNQWLKNLPDSIAQSDTILSISVASIEESDNRNPYTSPPGVFQERDRTRPDENILRNEQSLNLILKGLDDGDKREAVKILYRPLDVFNYKQMKLFIHGDKNNTQGSISYADTLNGVFQYSSEVYFRFGGDTNNYYEYRQPVFPDWNEVTFNFDDLTALKQARGDNDTSAFFQAVSGAPPGHFYVIKGNPTLTTVKFLSVGVVNLDNGFNTGPLFGEVWVNELRVVGADDSPGWAYSLSTSLKIADFATVSFNLSEKNPYFHRLADRFGSRVEQRNWSVSTDVNLLKIIPINLPESNLRLNYSHTESIGKPLYLPGSDIKVDKAVENQQILFDQDTTGLVKSPELIREETETENISDSWSASNIKLKIPTKFWLIRDTFNAITMGFNYNKAFSRGPTVLSNRSWIWNANLNYGLSLSPDYYFNPIDIPVVGVLFALLKDYSGTKVYFTPQNFSLSLTAKRNSSTNISRETKNSPSNEISSRDFTTSRGFNFSWKLTEGGFFNITTSYALNISSSLAHLETYADSLAAPRPESAIWSDIFNGAFFGRDNVYRQNFDIRTAPKLPSLFDINKYFTLTASYGSSYQWNNDFRQTIVGRSAGFTNKSSVGLTMRWKSLFDPFFKEDVIKQKNNLIGDKGVVLNKEPKVPQYDSLGNEIVVVDSSAMMDSLLVDSNKPSMVSRAVGFLVAAAKYVFLDYEMISFNFSNDNTLSKSGLKAQGTGFRNFWGIFYDDNAGPTRGFMLGLNSDVGPRVASGGTNLSDVYSQKNNIDFKTSRPLWEGAKIDLSWKTGWSVNKNSTLTVNEDGTIFVSNVNATGTLNRSFLTFPPVLFLSAFKSGIKQVAELYNPQDPNSSLSDAFVKGFESLPIFSNFSFLKDFAKYVPRPNWRITWDGLEKLPFLKSIADRISLDHSYSSSYTEGWKLSREGNEVVQVQKIEYGFAPLLGLNLTFGQLWGGNLTGNLKYSTRTSFDLGITTKNITENFSKDIGFTLQFSKSGFELPLFGVALKNDIEFSLAYTSTRSAAIRYDMSSFTEDGTPQDGTTRLTIEPRIKYTISAKVTLSIFYKRSTVEPEGASRIPPTTSNEAGLDVSISIN